MRREEKSNRPRVGHALDLRGVPCPLSWAKAKVRLEALAKGDELTVWVDDPKGARDIPRAAEAEGYVVEEVVADGDAFRIRMQV